MDDVITPLEEQDLPERIARELRKLAMSTSQAAPAPAPQPETPVRLFDVRDWRLTPAIAVVILVWMFGGAWWCWTLQSDVRDLKDANSSYKEDRARYREGIAKDQQAVRDILGTLPNIVYRLTQLEAMPKTINDRMDRAFDVFNARFDGLAKSGSDVSGDIKAMRSELEGMRRAVDRLEAGRSGNAPFGQGQSWPYRQTSPFDQRARTGCPDSVSPLVEALWR